MEADILSSLIEALEAGGNVVVIVLAYGWYKLDKRLSRIEFDIEVILSRQANNNNHNGPG